MKAMSAKSISASPNTTATSISICAMRPGAAVDSEGRPIAPCPSAWGLDGPYSHAGKILGFRNWRVATSTDTVYSSGSGTYHGTSTKTTYEEKKYEHTTLFIKAFVHKVIEVDGKKNIARLP